MKRKYLTLITGLLVFALSATSCGSKESSKQNASVAKPTEDSIDTSNLKSGNFYIYHNGETYSPYFGAATFDKDQIKTSVSKEDVMWFKEDFSKIPTMYQGDRLIYYSKDDFKEEFTYERFKDLGYSVGLCGIKVLNSGRYSISTDKKDNCTYPNGDTDALLLLNNSNKYVILESLGNTKLRTVNNEETGENYTYLSNYGTITGLTKGEKYAAKVYAGTVEHDYTFTADVEILGAMEIYKTSNYDFIKQYVAEIEFPEWFNSGYYMINGCGIFRYINGTTADNTTNYNVANVDPDADISITPIDQQYETQTAEAAPTGDADGGQKATFSIDGAGDFTVNVIVTRAQGEENTQYEKPLGYLETPDGQYYQFDNTESDDLTIKFRADQPGEYTAYVYGLGNRTASLRVQ